MRQKGSDPFWRAALDVLEAEAALDAEVAAGDVVVERGCHLDDLVVLHVQRQVEADAEVGADRVGLRLLRLVPRAGVAVVALALEHERAGRADGDAVAAVDARRAGQRHRVLRGDAGVEPAPGDGDRERVLPVAAAALDALVAEDALRVVAHVQLVVDLHRLRDGRGRLAVAGVVVAGRQMITLAVLGGRGGRAVPLGPGLVLGHPLVGARRGGEVDRGAEELEHHLAGVADALRRGLDLHPVLDLARARRDEHPRPLHLDHADAAGVHRRERLAEAQRGDVEAGAAAGVEDRLALAGPHRLPVDLELDRAPQGDRDGAHETASVRNGRRPRSADSIAFAAVWPRPQIEASRMPRAISSSSASSSSTEPRGRSFTSRRSASCWRTVPTRQGTHWPHDSSRKNAAIRSSTGARGTVSSKTMITPLPSVTPASRVASNDSSRSSMSGPTNAPAAPPSRIDRSSCPARTPPAMSSISRSVTPNGASYRPGRSTQPDRQNRRIPVEPSVPRSANARPPSRTMSSTFTSVSTLLITVGFWNSPASTGNGGLLSGSPRKPSIELKRAVDRKSVV